MNDDVVAAGFDDGERRLLETRAADEGVEWPLRLWCAKEAAGKALGHGFHNDPRHLRGEAMSSDGAIDIAAFVEQSLPGTRSSSGGVRVFTAFDGEFALAICPVVIPAQQRMYERTEQPA